MVLSRVVKSEFKGAVRNSLIVWVVIVPNKTFRPLQKKEEKRKKRQEKEKKEGAESVIFFVLCLLLFFSDYLCA